MIFVHFVDKSSRKHSSKNCTQITEICFFHFQIEPKTNESKVEGSKSNKNDTTTGKKDGLTTRRNFSAAPKKTLNIMNVPIKGKE